MIQTTLTAVITALLLPLAAHAFPLPKGPKASMRPPASFTADYDFEGIVALSNCSGSLIQLENAPDSDNALMLTNGHCFEDGMPEPGEVIHHQPAYGSFTLLDRNGRGVGRLTAMQILYATMTKTDMAVYRLKQTYADIRSRHNVRPLTLSSRHPQIGTAIEVISGYWKRGFTCRIEHFVHELLEARYLMSDSIRYSRPGCEVFGGTSGSPIVEAGTRNVIGINNTGNEDGQHCSMNNPCEIDENGNKTAVRGYSYGQQTYWFYSCLNADRELDLSLPGCELPH